jgi:hypothetical protein
MDKHTLSHENDGAQGSGFTGKTASNNYSELPRSSNAELGIDANVAAGVSDEHGEIADTTSSLKNWGVGPEITSGTVPARRLNDITTKDGYRGQFGTSALSGGTSKVNEDTVIGPGARKAGTAAASFGEPGRGGSMALAINGLSGSTSGPDLEDQKVGKSASAATLKSRADAAKGLKGSNRTD